MSIYEHCETFAGRPVVEYQSDDKAPPEVVQRERDKLADLRQRLQLLDERLATLRAMSDES